MKKNYSETILGKNTYALVPFTVPIGRQEPMPIDATSVWYDRKQLNQYLNSPLCYPGQILTLVEGDKTEVYVVDGEIKPEGQVDTVTGVHKLGEGSGSDSTLGDIKYFKVVKDTRFEGKNNDKYVQNNGDTSTHSDDIGDGVTGIPDLDTKAEEITEPEDGDLLIYDGKNKRWTNAKIGLGFNKGKLSISLNDKVMASISLGIVNDKIVVLAVDDEGTMLDVGDDPDNPTLLQLD